MEKKFLKGEIVWAKVRGFPWWPAIVRSINCSIRHEQKEGEAGDSRESQPNESAFTAVVYFVGDDSHSELPLNKIEKFQQNLEEYSKTKKKTLLNSIHIAKKIIAGEIPFDKHMHYARKKNMNFTEEQFERKSNNRKSLSVYREIENNKEIIGRERNENKEDNLLGKKRRLIRKAAENEDENDNSNVSLSHSHYFNSPARTSTPEFKFTHAFNNSASSSANFSNSILNTNYTNPSANFNKTNPLGGVKANITKTSNFNSNITSINSITCPNNINVTNGNSFNGNKVTGNGNTHHQIGFRVKDDLSNNININININVNNTNNNMNINTFGRYPKKKIIDDFEDEIYASKSEKEKTAKFNTENGGSSIATNCIEKAGKTSLITNILDESCASRTLSDEERESSLHEDPYEVRTSKQEMKEAVDSLLFYKIDMPATSSNRSIISSLNLIEETLPKLKNCGIYTVNTNLILEFLAA